MAKQLHEMTPAEYDAYRLKHGFGTDGRWLGPPIMNPPMPYYVRPVASAPAVGVQIDMFGENSDCGDCGGTDCGGPGCSR